MVELLGSGNENTAEHLLLIRPRLENSRMKGEMVVRELSPEQIAKLKGFTKQGLRIVEDEAPIDAAVVGGSIQTPAFTIAWENVEQAKLVAEVLSSD